MQVSLVAVTKGIGKYENLTTEEIIELRNIPLGTNVGNVSLFILDERLELVPVGATGEIYIGGVGLARGYWQKPEHTAQTFIANPFTDIKDFPNALGSLSAKVTILLRSVIPSQTTRKSQYVTFAKS